jgi:hypothetical protein
VAKADKLHVILSLFSMYGYAVHVKRFIVEGKAPQNLCNLLRVARDATSALPAVGEQLLLSGVGVEKVSQQKVSACEHRHRKVFFSRFG